MTRILRDSRGLTLLEVLIAASLLLILFFGLSLTYMRGRTQVDYEEDRRKATAVAQARLDGIRRDFRYDDLPGLDGTDTTFVVDNRTFTVSHSVAADVPEPQATTMGVTVTWNAKVNGADVSRTLTTATILGRGMP